jgi:hypothetical protein
MGRENFLFMKMQIPPENSDKQKSEQGWLVGSAFKK